MGDILTVYKLYPESIDDIENIENDLKKEFPEPFKVRDIKLEPIAFGLKLIKVAIVFPDKVDGLLEKLENKLSSISGVRNIEVETSTLL